MIKNKSKLMVISILSACLLLCSCKNQNQEKAPKPDSNISESTDKTENPAIIVPPIENGDEIYVMRIGNYYVSYNEFRYYFMGYKEDMDGGNENYWKENPKAMQELSLTIIDSIKMVQAIKQVAIDENLTLTEDEKAILKKACDDYKASFESEEAYFKMLEEKCLSDKMFREQEEIFALADKVKTHFCEIIENPLSEDEYFEMLYKRMNEYEVRFFDEYSNEISGASHPEDGQAN